MLNYIPTFDDIEVNYLAVSSDEPEFEFWDRLWKENHPQPHLIRTESGRYKQIQDLLDKICKE